jgi:hypothetical protein
MSAPLIKAAIANKGIRPRLSCFTANNITLEPRWAFNRFGMIVFLKHLAPIRALSGHEPLSQFIAREAPQTASVASACPASIPRTQTAIRATALATGSFPFSRR